MTTAMTYADLLLQISDCTPLIFGAIGDELVERFPVVADIGLHSVDFWVTAPLTSFACIRQLQISDCTPLIFGARGPGGRQQGAALVADIGLHSVDFRDPRLSSSAYRTGVADIGLHSVDFRSLQYSTCSSAEVSLQISDCTPLIFGGPRSGHRRCRPCCRYRTALR